MCYFSNIKIAAAIFVIETNEGVVVVEEIRVWVYLAVYIFKQKNLKFNVHQRMVCLGTWESWPSSCTAYDAVLIRTFEIQKTDHLRPSRRFLDAQTCSSF